MTSAHWYSLPDRPSQTLGATDVSHIDDDETRRILEKFIEWFRQLQGGCEYPILHLRAHCWSPDVTSPIYGYHHAAYNTMVRARPLSDGAESPTRTRTITLPDAVLRPGGIVEVVDEEGTADITNITVGTVKGQTINGSATYVIADNYQAAQFRSDGTNWIVIGNGAGGASAPLGGNSVKLTRVELDTTLDATHGTIFADTDSAAVTITLPASPKQGQSYRIANVGSSGNNVTIARNGKNIEGAAANGTLVDGDVMILEYDDTEGWW